MKKVSNLKTAILYAQAMYSGAEQDGELSAFHKNAKTLLNLINDGVEEFSIINNPIGEIKDKYIILDEVIKKLKFCNSMGNFLKVLAQNHRLNLLEIILKQFISLYNDKHNIAEVDVTTVIELSSEQDKRLKSKLSDIFNKKIEINYIINPEIVGGLVIKYGTNLIDVSIKHKLDTLEKIMKGTK